MAVIKDLLSAMIEKINSSVRTVNGIAADEKGNVKVDSASSWNDLTDKPFGETYIPVDADFEYGGVSGSDDERGIHRWWVNLRDGVFINPSKTYAFEINGEVIGHSNGFRVYRTYGESTMTGDPYWIDDNVNYNSLPFAFCSLNAYYNPDGTCAGRVWELFVDLTLFPETENLKVRVLELEVVKTIDTKYLFTDTVVGKEYALFNGEFELDESGEPYYGKPKGLPQAGKSYTVIWDGVTYSNLPVQYYHNGDNGIQYMLGGSDDHPFFIGFMIDQNDTAIFGAMGLSGSHTCKVMATNMQPVVDKIDSKHVTVDLSDITNNYKHCVKFEYNYANDEFINIYGADNASYFCRGTYYTDIVYIPLENIPTTDELIGGVILNYDTYSGYVVDSVLITGDMINTNPDWSPVPGVAFSVFDTNMSACGFYVCDGEDALFGPGLYFSHRVGGLAWGGKAEQINPMLTRNFVINFEEVPGQDNEYRFVNDSYENIRGYLESGCNVTLVSKNLPNAKVFNYSGYGNNARYQFNRVFYTFHNTNPPILVLETINIDYISIDRTFSITTVEIPITAATTTQS